MSKAIKKPASAAVTAWRWQRLTAVAMIPLSIWLMVALVTHLQTATPQSLAAWLGNTAVALGLAALLLAASVHKHIGLHEIITDYIHCPCKKKLANLVLNLGTLALTLVTLAAIWHLHHVGAAA